MALAAFTAKYLGGGAATVATAQLADGVFGLGLIFPNDLRHFFAASLGVFVGTLAAYVWEDQSQEHFDRRRWILWQIGTWGLIIFSTMWVQEYLQTTIRATIVISGVASFLGRDGISRARDRALQRVEGFGLPPRPPS